MELTFLPLPEDAGTISGLDLVCKGWIETYNVDELSNADWYQWVIDPAEAGETEDTGHEITINWSEDYTGDVTLKVQGINDCGEGIFSQDFSVVVDACTGIDEVTNLDISLSPNPSNGYFTLQSALSDGTMEIIDLSGKVVFKQNIDGQKMAIDVANLNEGMYFIKLYNNNQSSVEKMVIRK